MRTRGGPQGPPPFFDLGAGLNFEMDTAELAPVVRLKIGGLVSIKVSQSSDSPLSNI